MPNSDARPAASRHEQPVMTSVNEAPEIPQDRKDAYRYAHLSRVDEYRPPSAPEIQKVSGDHSTDRLSRIAKLAIR
jgi:hypothetical protein